MQFTARATRATPWALTVLAFVIVGSASLLGCKRSPRVDAWPPNDGGQPDSIARGIEALIGAPPALLAGCGPHHVLIGFVDAPGEIPLEFGETANGTSLIIVSPAEQRRKTVGAEIASVYFSIAGSQAADTVTVELVRRADRPPNVGSDATQFAFVPNQDARPRGSPTWISRGAARCQRTVQADAMLRMGR